MRLGGNMDKTPTELLIHDIQLRMEQFQVMTGVYVEEINIKWVRINEGCVYPKRYIYRIELKMT